MCERIETSLSKLGFVVTEHRHSVLVMFIATCETILLLFPTECVINEDGTTGLQCCTVFTG